MNITTEDVFSKLGITDMNDRIILDEWAYKHASWMDEHSLGIANYIYLLAICILKCNVYAHLYEKPTPQISQTKRLTFSCTRFK